MKLTYKLRKILGINEEEALPTIVGAAKFIEAFVEFKEDQLKELEAFPSMKDYDKTPNWSHKMAHVSGRREELKDTINYLTKLITSKES